MSEVVVIAHNVRSSHNVGSLLRTCEGLGVSEIILTGYTPYPVLPNDARLPHLAAKIDKQISKTALGAEHTIAWHHDEDIRHAIQALKSDGFTIMALEQTPTSTSMPDFTPPEKLALIVGREVEGIEHEVLALADGSVEIPMRGTKESFNVVQAAAMALYHCIYLPKH